MSDTKHDRDNAIDLLEAQVDLLNSLTTILLRRSFNNDSVILEMLESLKESPSRSLLIEHAFKKIIGELSRDLPVAFRDI